MSNIFAERVEALRGMMRGKGWDAVIVRGSDPHNSEYPSERWKQVQWLSGFTGEAGDMVVTLDHAGLWTDTRYFIQANAQLAGTGIELHKTRVPEQVLIPQWLKEVFAGQEQTVIALDGLCNTASSVEEIKDALDARAEVISVPDMLEPLWSGRPEIPQTPVFEAGLGESRAEKIAWLRAEMHSHGCDCVLVTVLDEIAWLLNVRASDIDYNPFAISYLLVDTENVRWFVHDGEDIVIDGVTVLPYQEFETVLSTEAGCYDRIMIDPGSLNYHISNILRLNALGIEEVDSPVQLRKAVKNAKEIEGARKAHFLDGLAMEKFLYWLEKSLAARKRITEWDAAVKLGRLRREIDGYRDDSFETISAYGKGAALPHYVTPKVDSPVLEASGLYLCDSGGQFDYGTTDITRTVPLGECTALEKEDYTLVLKGHIDLAMAIFPKGTPGCRIDALAREPLWKAKRNFGHGTGHGVGSFLGVHEGPQDVRQNMNGTPLLEGMVISDEPGIYREGKHGVRHENLLLVRSAGSNDFGAWMEFETLTLCHFDTSAVVRELLTEEERNWLNAYNARVYESFKADLPDEVSSWLKEKTAAI